jgi:hypothetical protein
MLHQLLEMAKRAAVRVREALRCRLLTFDRNGMSQKASSAVVANTSVAAAMTRSIVIPQRFCSAPDADAAARGLGFGSKWLLTRMRCSTRLGFGSKWLLTLQHTAELRFRRSVRTVGCRGDVDQFRR